MPDYIFENHGSLWLCHASNADALEWLRDHVSEEAQWMGDAVAVEPRYVIELTEQLVVDGFTVGGGF